MELPEDSLRPTRSRCALALVLAASPLLSSAQPAAGFGFVTKWRIRGTPPITASRNAVYVGAANLHSQWLQRYTTRGSLVTQWRLPGANATSMHVMALATDAEGNIYALVANHARTENRVLKYTDRGRQLDQWGVGGGPTARGIAVGPAGNVYVAITANDQVETYSPVGRLLRRFEAPAPSSIAADRGGNVYVAGLTVVSVYCDDGTFVRAWKSGAGPASSEPGPGGLEVPTAVAVNPAGRVLVADGGRTERDVKIYTPEGILVGQIGGPGRGNGRFRYSPNELAIDGSGSVYVASLKTIQKFGEPPAPSAL